MKLFESADSVSWKHRSFSSGIFSGSCNATLAFLEEYERTLAYLHRLQGISASFEAAVLPVQKDEVSAASGGGYSSRLRHRAQFT